MKTFKEENLKEIINYQMELNWYSERYDDLKKIDEFYTKFTTTKEKEKEYIEYLKKYIKPFVVSTKLDKGVWHIILNYWLKIKEK